MSLHLIIGPMYAGKTSTLIKTYLDGPIETSIIIDYDITVNQKVRESKMINHNFEEIDAIKSTKLYDLNNIYKISGNFYNSRDMLPYDLTSFNHNEFNEKEHRELFVIPMKLRNATHIYINEGQFFPDLYDFVIEYLKKDVNIYIYGLDGDYKQEKIGTLLELIPFCDSVRKLNGKCEYCDNNSIYTKRVSDSKEQYDPHGKYVPVCRKCIS